MFDSKIIAKRALLRAEEIIAQKNRQSKYRIIFAALLGCCVLVITVIVIPLTTRRANRNEHIDDIQIPLSALLLPDDSAKPYIAAAGKSIEKDAIVAMGYSSVTIPAGSVDITMPLLNPEGNCCLFSFEITVNEETLYKSGAVEPGMCIESFKLAKPFEEGEYKAILIIKSYELDNYEDLNSMMVSFTIMVK